MDDAMIALLDMIRQDGGTVSCEDVRLEQFTVEDEHGNDAINRLIQAGHIYQYGSADFGENFYLKVKN